ncbi:MAG: glycosyltransferase family 4 protein [Planctomycetaceae bacterium]
MKIAHVITRLIVGGAQENTLLSVLGQRETYGDQVALITGPGLGPEGSLEPSAVAAGVDLRLIPEMRRAIHPWRDWRAYAALCRMLSDLRPDIVHTHSSKAGILGRMAAAELGIPVVHTIHGSSFHRNQAAVGRWLTIRAERWAARRSDRLISVCDAMTDQYVAAGVAERELFTTIHSGMHVDGFLRPTRSPEAVRAELGLDPGHIVVGKVARLFHLEGHADVIRAAARIADAIPELRFVFVGEGILRQQFEDEIREAGLADRFIFTGLVTPERVAELVHAMDVVVHTSLREGLARVLPQALIAGKPVVSYDIDGAREVVINGETGALIAAGEIELLADALRELALDGALRARLGHAGRERFTEQFRHETMNRKIREVYSEVLGSVVE